MRASRPAIVSASQARPAACSACSMLPASTSRPCLAYSCSTDTSPSRSRSDAGPSHASSNRRTSASWYSMPRFAMSASAPPAPTAASCFWSPTRSSFTPAAEQRRWMATRSGVDAAPASSTTSRSPRRSRNASSSPSARPSSRRACPSSQRRMFRAVTPSSASTSAWRCPYATPNTRGPSPPTVPGGSPPGSAVARGWPVSGQVSARVPTRNDFPVPAGALRTSTAAPEVRMPRSAVAWSALSSRPARANRATIASASSVVQAGAPRRTAAARSSPSPRICPGVANRSECGLTNWLSPSAR